MRTNLDDMEGRSRINMMVAEELGRQAIADPEFMDRARARLLGETIQKQENLESVLIAANKLIEEQGEGVDASIPDDEPTQDWINSFTREAELASSEELRERLASILAGEIQSPGSVSRSTIRAVAEMEKTLLDQFMSVLKSRCGDAIIKEGDWTSGQMFTIGMALESEGLIYGVTGSTYKSVNFDANGTGLFLANHLVLLLIGNANAKLKIKCWFLTKVGIEIANLLDTAKAADQARLIANHIDKNGLKTIILAEIPVGGGELIIREQLWAAPSAPS